MLSKKAIERLGKLADYMALKVPEEEFNIGDWLGLDTDDDRIKSCKVITSKDIAKCGTTACALGHAASAPFRDELGLSMKLVPWTKGDRDLSARSFTFFYKNKETEIFEAAAKAFDITKREAELLFGAQADAYGMGNSTTPREWAIGARKFIADRMYGDAV